ncbi:MAG TPA: hypothetical protein VF192_04900 [Longimicrobiales bacterium]
MDTSPGPVRQEDDAVRTKPVVAALVAATLLAGGSVLWGWIQLRVDTAAHAPRRPAAARPPPAGPPAVSGVLQTLVGVDSATAMLTANRRARLEGWGWVDRGRGVVHIPIEAAMRALVEQGEPSAAHEASSGSAAAATRTRNGAGVAAPAATRSGAGAAAWTVVRRGAGGGAPAREPAVRAEP